MEGQSARKRRLQQNLQLLPAPTQTDNTMQFSTSSSSKTHPKYFTAEKTTSRTEEKEEKRSRNFHNKRNGKKEEKQQQWR
jgi:predicted chitinase